MKHNKKLLKKGGYTSEKAEKIESFVQIHNCVLLQSLESIKNMRSVIISIICLVIQCPGFSQDVSRLQSLDLNDLSAFRAQDGNWRIVGSVMIDPSKDIHDKIPAPSTAKKSKKQAPPEMIAVQPVTWTEGKGVLLNMNDDKVRSHLLTVMEHGDIELELELMVPKGSNSGIYLQGRYEVQILDSWGVRKPAYSDIGGIYRNWETKPGEIYMGKAPLTNAAKAPGLWQKMQIIFQAPRFDAAGKKISNAKFISVRLNGVTIHDNLEVPLATGGPVDKRESAVGPLMIQGDHGPVAFRNIRYRMMREITPSIGPVSWDVFHGNFKTFNDFLSLKPAYSGNSAELSCEVIDVEDAYGVSYAGDLNIPEAGLYLFATTATGGIRLLVDDKIIFDKPGADRWDTDFGSVSLSAGRHSFRIINYKDAGWMPPRLYFSVRISDGKEIKLHSINSYPPDPNPVSSIVVQAGAEPRLLRAFVDFNGDRKKRLTHTIGVAEPSGVHYIYDLGSGNLSCVWRGDFVDATPMWNDRGDGSFRPMGAAQFTFLGQPLARLENADAPFPTGNSSDYLSKGYEIDVKSGRPVFRYIYKGIEVTGKINPDTDHKYLVHQISVKEGTDVSGLYYKLAEGTKITRVPDGSFAIDDHRYFIKVNTGSAPVIRTSGDKQELILPVTGTEISWSLIW